jgi:non-ribosomal peptide synthase protein (TIGR01720 family)
MGTAETRTGIAVIGLAGRFPKARDIDQFWENLRDGVDCVTDFTEEELRDLGVPPATLDDPTYVRARPYLEDAELFDAAFFGTSPTEARVIDPQQRLLLECAVQALEHAGYDPTTYDGAIGVYAGASMNTYLSQNIETNRELMDAVGELPIELGNDKDYVATRISYKLNLRGPSVNVQSACSTSLVAVHLACESLLSGESDIVLAGGVAIRSPIKGGYGYEEGSIVSPDGRCRPFDAHAQGTVFGDGVGLVVLKRLEDALADRDTIYAVVKGSAVNNDGALKIGFTAPSIEGQAAVIAEAQAVADVTPDEIEYVEAHGTATALGDPIEIAALSRVFQAGTDRRGYCGIGSIKSNIGHLNTAAGVAGLIKTILALRHHQIPPSLHFERPNPRIDFESSPFYVNAALRDWPATEGRVRHAGISAFGIGGTNAHAVLAEAPRQAPSGPSRPWQILPVSTQTVPALDQASDALAEHLRSHPDLDIADAAYTLQVGRRAFAQRRVVVGTRPEHVIEALDSRDARRVATGIAPPAPPSIAFLFPGQGAQHVSMAADIYRDEPAFRTEVDRCAELLEPHLGFDIRTVIYPPDDEDAQKDASERLKQTCVTQPALFTVEYALARLWMHWGVRPTGMLGHSIGEYVAACLAGVFSLQDALRLVATRGRLMQALPPGAMLAVPLPVDEARPLLDPSLSIAAINGPDQCVASGPREAIEALHESLARRGVEARTVPTSHAFHSAMMEPMLAAFTEEVTRTERRAPEIPYLSNLTGTWATAEQATDPQYWASHVRGTVQFEAGLRTLLAEPNRLLLEVGPGRAFQRFARHHPDRTERQVVLASLRHQRDPDSDWAALLMALGQLWITGVEVDWRAFTADEQRTRVALPTYPFQRQRYWIEPGTRAESLSVRELATRRRTDLADWFWAPSWRRAPAVPPAPGDAEADGADETAQARTLVFLDDRGIGAEIVKRLQQHKQDVVGVMAAGHYTQFSDAVYAIDPGRRADYDELVAELVTREWVPTRILHAGGVTPTEQTETSGDLDGAHDGGFRGLVYLAQALAEQGVTSPISVTVVGNGVFDVTGAEPLQPTKAAVLGTAKVLPLEYANLQCRYVDVELPAADDPVGKAMLAERLLREADLPLPLTTVAYRGRYRWEQAFEPVRLGPAPKHPIALRDGGTYLITGGLGGLGLEFAEYIAREAHGRLVLTGRSWFPPREEWDSWLRTHGADDKTGQKIRRLLACEAAGGQVTVKSADVADLEQMRSVVETVSRELGPLHGVIHAAGVPAGGIMQLKTDEAMTPVLAPKVRGTLVLDEVLRDLPVDFVVLCSSLIGISGQVGQVDYCAANAFLDAYAHAASRRGSTPVISINWPGWEAVGMLARTIAQGGLDAANPPHVSRNGHASISRNGHADGTGNGRLHPLAQHRVEGEAAAHVFSNTFAVSTEWILSEHRIAGQATVPGTGYLEMVRAALQQTAQPGAIELRNVTFLRPLIVPEDGMCEVRTVLNGSPDGFQVSVVSTSGTDGGVDWQDHLMGDASLRPIGQPPERRDLDAIRARCTTVVQDEAFGDGQLFDFGRRWDCLRSVHVGRNEGLARLELHREYADDLAEFGLHPALLDVATSFLVSDLAEAAYLPVFYERVLVHAPLPGALYSHARLTVDPDAAGETLSLDVDLLDDDGRLLVEIQGFTLRRVDALGTTFGQDGSAASGPDGAAVRQRFGVGISPEEGVDAFGRILSALADLGPQIAVCQTDLPAMILGSRAAEEVGAEEQSDEASAQVAHPRPSLASAYLAPRDDAERRLAQVWQEVLGVAEVGVDDNFFELGGDSVSALRVITSAKQLGIQLTPQQLFQTPTVAALAALGGHEVSAPAPTEQAPVVGPVPLTPIQHWFFETHPVAPNEAGRTVLLEVPAALTGDLVETALRQVLHSHDAFWLRIEDAASGWQQRTVAPSDQMSVRREDLSEQSRETQAASIEAAAREALASFDLARGPLVQATLFTLGSEAGNRLLLVGHPLVIDEESWRILVEDLLMASVQGAHGERARPLATPTSFTAWSERLAARAAAGLGHGLVERWVSTDVEQPRLPLASPECLSQNTWASARTTSVQLSLEESRLLLEEVPRIHNLEPSEVLLTGLVETIAQWIGSRALAVYLQGSARRLSWDGVDLSRTVGNFDTIFPVLLDLQAVADPAASLKAVKEAVRSVPDEGIDFGLARYGHDSDDLAARLDRTFPRDVRFTFERDLAEAIPERSTLRLVEGPLGLSTSADDVRPFLLDLSARVENGSLRLDLTWSERLHERDQMERLVEQLGQEVSALLTYCTTHQAVGYTPTDFPDAEIGQSDLDKIVAQLR